MIGPDAHEGSGLGSRHGLETTGGDAGVPDPEVQKELAVRWGIGCLVGGVALVGVLLLSALLAFYLQPPAWVQIVVGLLLTAGGVVLAWLVATAWGRSRHGDARASRKRT